MKRFIVVAWFHGTPYMLQYRGVVEWFFYNNHIKLFKTKKTAIKAAVKVAAKYRYDTIKSTDNIHKWERDEAERIEFELAKVTTNA